MHFFARFNTCSRFVIAVLRLNNPDSYVGNSKRHCENVFGHTQLTRQSPAGRSGADVLPKTSIVISQTLLPLPLSPCGPKHRLKCTFPYPWNVKWSIPVAGPHFQSRGTSWSGDGKILRRTVPIISCVGRGTQKVVRPGLEPETSCVPVLIRGTVRQT